MQITVASGGGKAGTFPSPEIGKIVIESGVLFHMSILSERIRKSKKYLVQSCEKSQFSIEILIKKSQKIFEIFQNSFDFWSKRARFCRPVA